MNLSVVICTHNRHELCLEAVRSVLAQQDASGQIEVIVVDNSLDAGSARGLEARLRGEGDVRFLHTTEIGLSRARNIGAEAARGDIVAYLDDDAVASPRWGRSLIDAFATFDGPIGAIGGPVRPSWVESPPSWLNGQLLDFLSVVDRGPQMRALNPTEWLAGCNIAFAKDALAAVGGFDTGLGRSGGALLSNEETIVCDRLRALGRAIVYAPAALVDHVIDPRRVTVDWVRRRIVWQAISDAISHADPSRARAQSDLKYWGPVARCAKALRFYRLLGPRCRSMSRRDHYFIYELALQLVCREGNQDSARS